MYTQRRVKYIGFAGRRAKKKDFTWVVGLALVCALLIWVAVQIRDQGRAVYPAETQFPRNTVDMHGTYTGDAHAPPWFCG